MTLSVGFRVCGIGRGVLRLSDEAADSFGFRKLPSATALGQLCVGIAQLGVRQSAVGGFRHEI